VPAPADAGVPAWQGPSGHQQAGRHDLCPLLMEEYLYYEFNVEVAKREAAKEIEV
jgi:hypothetical protein